MRRVMAGTMLFVLALVIVSLPGCGSLSSQRAEGAHAVLDVVTDVVDPLYSSAVIGCDATEGVIIARESTREEDERDIAAVREACDRVFAAFEAVRRAQLAARAAVEAARADAESDAAQQAAFAAVAALHSAAQAARGIWEDVRPVLEGVTQTAGGTGG